MAESNLVLKKLIESCCRSLSYNDDERQFTFPLRPCITSIWDSLKKDTEVVSSEFYLNDFNKLLSRLADLQNQYSKIGVRSISDINILTGEVLEVSLIGKENPLRLIKMKDNQYLDANIGKGYSLGGKNKFIEETCLKTSEGYELGQIKSIALLSPSCEHFVLSKLFIGNYYRNKISNSIWPIFDKVVNDGVPKYDTDLTIFFVNVKKNGDTFFYTFKHS